MAIQGLQKVAIGQSMGSGFPAGTYNAMIDVINAYRRGELNRPQRDHNTIRTAGVIWVKNSTGSNQPRGAVLGISQPIVLPSEDDNVYNERVAVVGITPTTAHVPDQFVILNEPIPPNAIGRATISGIASATCYVDNASHQYAAVYPGSTSTLLSSINGGAKILWRSSTGMGNLDVIVRLGEGPEVGLVLIDGTIDEPATPAAGSYYSATLLRYGVVPDWEDVWVMPINSGGELLGQDTYVGMRIGPITVSGSERNLYMIRADKSTEESGKVKVNVDDALDYLEDQFKDHVTGQYGEGDVLINTQTETTGADSTVRAFIDMSGYSTGFNQVFWHDQGGSDTPKWKSVTEVTVITDLRIHYGQIQKKTSTITVLDEEQHDWEIALPATEC